ncbi:MAG TPA: hypothetical protein VN035_15430, partial [Microbacterium sp.]|nr:hypothetical protein [Microbacterium sp.]
MTWERTASRRWLRTPAVLIGTGAAVVLAGMGLALSRPDVIVLAVPLAIWSLLVVDAERRRPGAREDAAIGVRSDPDTVPGALDDLITVETDAEIAELFIVQSARRRRRVFVPGRATIRAHSRSRHSGPIDAVRVSGRSVD